MKAIEMYILKLDQTIKDSKRAPNQDVVKTMEACLQLAKDLYEMEKQGDELIQQLFKAIKVKP
jgi:flagellar biosynthesis chaperone FliJ